MKYFVRKVRLRNCIDLFIAFLYINLKDESVISWNVRGPFGMAF